MVLKVQHLLRQIFTPISKLMLWLPIFLCALTLPLKGDDVGGAGLDVGELDGCEHVFNLETLVDIVPRLGSVSRVPKLLRGAREADETDLVNYTEFFLMFFDVFNPLVHFLSEVLEMCACDIVDTE